MYNVAEYFFLIRPDGGMVWKGSGHGPAVYHSVAQLKRHGRQQAYFHPDCRILHMVIRDGKVSTSWMNWLELEEYSD